MHVGAQSQDAAALPGMIAQLRATGHTTPILLMTGRIDTEALTRIQNSGAAAVLEKPFDRTALLAAIATAMQAG